MALNFASGNLWDSLWEEKRRSFRTCFWNWVDFLLVDTG